VQLNQMTMGYRAARAVDSGAIPGSIERVWEAAPAAGADEMDGAG